jgi:hypothetical protein
VHQCASDARTDLKLATPESAAICRQIIAHNNADPLPTSGAIA